MCSATVRCIGILGVTPETSCINLEFHIVSLFIDLFYIAILRTCLPVCFEIIPNKLCELA